MPSPAIITPSVMPPSEPAVTPTLTPAPTPSAAKDQTAVNLEQAQQPSVNNAHAAEKRDVDAWIPKSLAAIDDEIAGLRKTHDGYLYKAA